MRTAFQRIFSDKLRCFDYDERTTFYVCDPKIGRAFIVRDPPKCKLTPIEVTNESGSRIDFIAVDSCLAPNDQSKCDFILSDNNILFLVEAKMEMTTLRQENADDVRAGAVGQLVSTINWLKEIFKENNEHFPANPRIRMYVCTFKQAQGIRLLKNTFVKNMDYSMAIISMILGG